jgi:hypothetical protein
MSSTARQGTEGLDDDEEEEDPDSSAFVLHYETAYLAKLKGTLAERGIAPPFGGSSILSSTMRNKGSDASLSSSDSSSDSVPGAADASDSSSDSDCDASLEEETRGSSGGGNDESGIGGGTPTTLTLAAPTVAAAPGPTPATTRVKFGSVSIRTYALTVGDAPGSAAYPLSLDWGHTATETLDFCLYEDLFSASAAAGAPAQPPLPYHHHQQQQQQRSFVRGFRKPRRLTTQSRLQRLAAVTGKSPAYLYELELVRMQKQGHTAVLEVDADSDDDDDEDNDSSSSGTSSNHRTYQLVDVDEYQRVDI